MGVAVGIILRAEQVAIFVTGVTLYFANGGPWWLLIPALLAPDLSAIGYLAGPRMGAIDTTATSTPQILRDLAGGARFIVVDR